MSGTNSHSVNGQFAESAWADCRSVDHARFSCQSVMNDSSYLWHDPTGTYDKTQGTDFAGIFIRSPVSFIPLEKKVVGEGKVVDEPAN